MKRYLLFVYEEYEQRGGWGDFVAAFNSIEAAKEHEASLRNNNTKNNAQIVDSRSGEVVAKLDTVMIGKFWNEWEYRWTP